MHIGLFRGYSRARPTHPPHHHPDSLFPTPHEHSCHHLSAHTRARPQSYLVRAEVTSAPTAFGAPALTTQMWHCTRDTSPQPFTHSSTCLDTSGATSRCRSLTRMGETLSICTRRRDLSFAIVSEKPRWLCPLHARQAFQRPPVSSSTPHHLHQELRACAKLFTEASNSICPMPGTQTPLRERRGGRGGVCGYGAERAPRLQLRAVVRVVRARA